MKSCMKIGVITRNKGKWSAAQEAFLGTGIELVQIAAEYPEIQASSIEIARHAALAASKDVGFPVIREDHSFMIDALGGFPGPFMNQIESQLSFDVLLRMLGEKKDRGAKFVLATAIAYPDGRVEEFVSEVPVLVGTAPRGDMDNWDPVLYLIGSEKSFAEDKISLRNDIWNKNFVAIAERLKTRDE